MSKKRKNSNIPRWFRFTGNRMPPRTETKNKQNCHFGETLNPMFRHDELLTHIVCPSFRLADPSQAEIFRMSVSEDNETE